MTILRIEADPFSLRDLAEMVDLRNKLDWDHTAVVVAMMHNSRMGMKSHQIISPESINPYRVKKKKRGGKIRIADMARGFGAK